MLIISLTSTSALFAQDDAAVAAGKKLFNANCAACHKLNKRAVGPALKGVSAKYDKEWLYSWIKNSTAMVKSGDAQAVAIYEEYNGSVMTSFPQLSNEDIDNIISYTDYTPPAPAAAAGVQGAPVQASVAGVSNSIILLALALVFAILVVMLFLVQKTLMRIAKLSGVDIQPEAKPKRTPIWMAFVQNQFLVMTSVVLLLLSSAYFVYGYFMQVGVDQG
ncbi:MAG: cytochrome c, partial [Flavobacteriaceae bacterium]|nr:cytochrome c [Flavobacteriaceae bacterium]